jgi:hypothetical protein
MVEKIRTDVLEQIEKQSGRRRTHPDSTTGITPSVAVDGCYGPSVGSARSVGELESDSDNEEQAEVITQREDEEDLADAIEMLRLDIEGGMPDSEVSVGPIFLRRGGSPTPDTK